MFVDQLKVPSEARLNQILHTLAHVHNFVLDQDDPQQLRSLQEHYTAEQSAIVESSAFNSYHANPAYVKASLITEAVRLLFEIAPKRRKKSVSESTFSKENNMTQLSEKEHKRKPDFLDVDKDGDKQEPMVKALKDKEAGKKLDEKWGTEMKTKPADVGKWEGWTVAELKARKKKLMAKDERTAKEQKEVRQINFAIRAKQEDSWGKIKKESVIMEDQNLDQAETLLAAKDLSDQLQGMAEDAAKMAVDKLMPLVDTMKAQFGQPAAEGFNSVVKDNLQKVLDTIIAAKDQTDNAILTLQGGGTPSMAADISQPLPAEQPMMPPEGEPAADTEIDFEQEFDAMPATSGPEQEPLGRAKKSELAEAAVKCKKCRGMMEQKRNRMICKECGYSMIAEAAPNEQHDVHSMAKTGKDAQGRPLTAQQKQAAKRAADELNKANLEEKLTKDMTAGEVISDFVKSDDPKFKGKSKAERTKMALGAYYGMHPEKSVKEDMEDQRIEELDMVIETLKSEFDQLKQQFTQHQHTYSRLVAEGREKDPLSTGYGLEGAALLQNIKKVRSRINEAVTERKQSLTKLNEAAEFKNSVNQKIQKLSEQLQAMPYGVVGVTKQGQKVKKFFENDEHLQMWLEFNRAQLSEHTVIGPNTLKAVQAKLKKHT